MINHSTRIIKYSIRIFFQRYSFLFVLIASLSIPVRLYGDSHDDLIDLAETAFLTGDFSLSQELYLTLHNQDRENPKTIYNAAYLAELLQQDQLADSLYHALLATRDNDIPSRYRLAQLALSKRDTSDCLNWLSSISSMKGETIQSLSLLGKLTTLRGNVERGLEYAQRAYNMNNNNPDAVIALAICYEQTGLVEEALQLIFETSQKNPRSELLLNGYEIAKRHDMRFWMDKFKEEFNLYYPYSEIDTSFVSDGKPVSHPDSSTNVSVVETWLKSPCRYTYAFKWVFFRLGTMIVDVGETVDIDGIMVIPVKYRITSSPHLPFIHLNDVYRAYLYPTLQKTIRYEMRVLETWWAYNRNYTMDYSKNILIIREVDSEGRLIQYTQGLPVNLLDGTSMMFYARELVRRNTGQNVLTLIDYDYAWTNIAFTGEQDEIKIAGIRRNCWIVEGSADYIGVAGLSGDFKGWFTTDDEALPLKAKFKVFIGSISLTLSNVEYFVEKEFFTE